MTTEELLQDCTIEGFVVKLPDIKLERKAYMDVAKKLELIGGKWKGNKVMGFVFNEDPTDMLNQIASGESRNIKKEFQFFGTPPKLSDILVSLAHIENGMSCLEPSAGQFAIGEAIYRAFPHAMHGPNDMPAVTVDYCELMPLNCQIISKKLAQNKNWLSRTSFMAEDFLKWQFNFKYDRIIANPPFSNNQDIDHIYQMFKVCKKGGRIVTMASNHWKLSSNKKEIVFRNWLDDMDSEIIDVADGEFKESGTSIATCIIIINL